MANTEKTLRQQFALEGQVVIITGAAHILGPEFAGALAEFGARLVLADINEEACRQAARRVRDTHGAEAVAVATDVSQEDSVAALVAEALKRFGRVDILVNAAAAKTAHYFDPLPEYRLDDWNQVMGVNLTGMFLCTKHVLPAFKARKAGNIINIASIYGIRGPDPRIYEGSLYEGRRINTPAVYSASKGAVVSFTRYLATTLASDNIRANCITPGGVFSGQNQTFVERYSGRVPMGRMARPDELKGAVLFLASTASSYVTGHNLVVDGGLSAW